MEFRFEGRVIEWRGPSPFYFLPLDAATTDLIAEMAAQLSYGWGCIPVRSTIGSTSFTTSLMPRNGSYLLPLKATVRAAEGLAVEHLVDARIEI